LLLDALPDLPERGWRLTIAGQEPLTEQVVRLMPDPRRQSKVTCHRTLPPDAYDRLMAEASAASLRQKDRIW